MISVIVPAHNEARYIRPCLEALLSSDLRAQTAEVIVVANGCSDETASVAREFVDQSETWSVKVIETEEPSKLNALNLGEAEAKGSSLAYLDADVLVSRDLIHLVSEALMQAAPRYASGRPIVVSKSLFARLYSRFWIQLPFVAQGVPGFGFFAVNRSGRARWGAFPDIISDDTFVRLAFTPSERVCVSAEYYWPMIDGFTNLVKVRRRQDNGVSEIMARFPGLLRNEDAPPLGLRRLAVLAMRDPIAFSVYALVKLAVKSPIGQSSGWTRGR